MIIYINLIINHYLNNNAIRNTTELLRLQNNIIKILPNHHQPLVKIIYLLHVLHD